MLNVLLILRRYTCSIYGIRIWVLARIKTVLFKLFLKSECPNRLHIYINIKVNSWYTSEIALRASESSIYQRGKFGRAKCENG